jgi:N6-adenosine-specific RNA methylase IME4
VICGSTAQNGRPIQLASESVCQTIFSPKREHSRKPDEVRERIDQLYPNATKLEMFSRGPGRDGWDLHGDEIGTYV